MWLIYSDDIFLFYNIVNSVLINAAAYELNLNFFFTFRFHKSSQSVVSGVCTCVSGQ